VHLFINGDQCGDGRIEKQVRGRFSAEPLDVGMDTLSPVSSSYPFVSERKAPLPLHRVERQRAL
jgi:hypothetical protein